MLQDWRWLCAAQMIDHRIDRVGCPATVVAGHYNGRKLIQSIVARNKNFHINIVNVRKEHTIHRAH